MRTFQIHYNGTKQGLQKAKNSQEAINAFKKAQERFLSINIDSSIYEGIKAI